MRYLNLYKFLGSIFLASLLMHTACRPASYEFVRDDDRNNSQSGNPNTFGPGDTNPNDDVVGNLPPSAGIEVIYDGKSVTKVRVGQAVSVRPTKDTADADDIGRSSCANPGITRADYDLDAGDKPSVDRQQGCETLAVPHTFTKEGDYKISLTVSTAENETATASMMVSVIASTGSITLSEGGFHIRAYPMIGTINQTITMDGFCETVAKNTITWNFGDSAKGTGIRVTHAYAREGQYRVDATCTATDGRTMRAHVTIVILKDPLPPGSSTTVIVPPPPNPPSINNPPPADPPNQGPGQEDDPDQNPPCQTNCDPCYYYEGCSCCS